MKITHAEVWNFGSYEHLEFSYSDQGLTLIAGPTGAGKTTLMDIIPWVLFSTTSKNGAVDEVRSWTGGVTRGAVTVQLGTRYVQIHRTRGLAKDNDLYFIAHDIGTDWNTEPGVRGKDLNDTQRTINELLGMTPELYLAGAYFHEFSQTASFFTAPAKVRRMITEQLVDLSLAKNLAERLSNAKKDTKTNTAEAEKLLVESRSLRSSTARLLAENELRGAEWAKSQDAKILKIQADSASFNKDKAKRIQELEADSERFEEQSYVAISRYTDDIKELELEITGENKVLEQYAQLKARRASLTDERCNECGAKKDSHHLLSMMQEESAIKSRLNDIVNAKRGLANAKSLLFVETKKDNPYIKQIAAEASRINTYAEALDTLRLEQSPYLKAIERHTEALKTHTQDRDDLQTLVNDLKGQMSDLETLTEVVDQFRGAIVKRAIKDLEQKTNDLLDHHFDAEMRVTFDIAQADKLEVGIMKDGNECSYSQLSKGQRQLLKLCFGVSVMKVVAQHHAVSFDAIFLDEFADGLDEAKKAQAFGLLQELSLSYSSVFAIDHSEGLKAMFDNRFDVSLVDGKSAVEKA